MCVAPCRQAKHGIVDHCGQVVESLLLPLTLLLHLCFVRLLLRLQCLTADLPWPAALPCHAVLYVALCTHSWCSLLGVGSSLAQ